MPSSAHDLKSRADNLRGNRTLGALDLAREAITLAQDWIAAGADLSTLAADLQQMHPGIAAVRNVGRLLLGNPSTVLSRLKDLDLSLREGNQRITTLLKTLIAPRATIITLSNSSTVREAFVGLLPAQVFIMESLPGGEGRSMAEALEEHLQSFDAEIQVIPDAAVGNVVPQVDCALVGIDTFDPGGSIYHKVGTLPLALCCRQCEKPFYAAGHSLKRVDSPLGPLPEPAKPPADQIFDRTPPELITRLVTEE